MVTASHKPRILIYSQRNIYSNALFRCSLYEFEDLICQMDSAEILAPQADLSSSRHQLAKRLAYHAPIYPNPGVQKVQVKGSYDVFLAVCGYPHDLLMVNAIDDWRRHCKVSVCLMDELWIRQMDYYRHFVSILKRFDIVVLYYSQSVKPLHERLGNRCVFMPPGVDTIKFCPYPSPPRRVIDVYSVGRRSEVTHQTLLKMAANDSFFYLHDSITGDQSINPREHRALFANVAKRSRYFIVNPGLIDRPDRRGDQLEIGNRYFEGAASGTIMVGEHPNNPQFGQLFDWPDAVVHLPYGSSDVDAVINELDAQPERQDEIRRTNVTRALMRHDWAYRWEQMLNIVGLEPLPELLQRKERLKALAEAAGQHGSVTREPNRVAVTA